MPAVEEEEEEEEEEDDKPGHFFSSTATLAPSPMSTTSLPKSSRLSKVLQSPSVSTITMTMTTRKHMDDLDGFFCSPLNTPRNDTTSFPKEVHPPKVEAISMWEDEKKEEQREKKENVSKWSKEGREKLEGTNRAFQFFLFLLCSTFVAL